MATDARTTTNADSSLRCGMTTKRAGNDKGNSKGNNNCKTQQQQQRQQQERRLDQGEGLCGGGSDWGEARFFEALHGGVGDAGEKEDGEDGSDLPGGVVAALDQPPVVDDAGRWRRRRRGGGGAASFCRPWPA